MVLRIFSVFDSKMNAFLPPFFTLTASMALRSFEDAVRSEGHDFGNHAEDYTLFELGSFNQHSGKVELLDTPHSLALAISFRQAALQEVTSS